MCLRRTEMKIMATLLMVSVVLLSGCQSMSRIHYRAGVMPVYQMDPSRIILAADFGDVQQDQTTQPVKKSSTDEKNKQNEESDEKQRESEEIQGARQYTEPGERVRQQTLLATGNATTNTASDSNVPGTGREASEALASVGRPGLTAPQPGGGPSLAITSRPGLQEGPATGLGIVSPFNILTPQMNLLSGTMGRCNDLVMAGFFGGSIANCEIHFGR